MDILILSTYDADGSGIFARQLLHSVQSIGYSAQIVTVTKSSPNPDVSEIFARRSWKGFVYSVKTRVSRRLYRTKRDYAFLETCSIRANAALSADIWPNQCRLVICTFLSGMLSPQGLLRVIARLGNPPVMFYGVDMNLFTGGCHYARTCRGYISDCSNCPATNSIARLLVKGNFRKKLNAVRMLAGHSVVASSNEHFRQISESRVFGESDIRRVLMPVCDITYGANEESRLKLKAEYGFGNRTLLVRSSSEPRKGGQLFVECIRKLHLSSPDLVSKLDIVAIGDQYIAKHLSPLGLRIYSLGYIADENELSRLYSASDLFINTSLADGGPMMLTQSLMSFTPVITTDVGLSRDLVEPGLNGSILKEAVPDELAAEIEKYCLSTDHELNAMRINARNIALERASKEVYKDKLSKLIRSVIGN